MAKPKTYVATRDQLRVHDGHIHGGEGYPAAEVTPSLLNAGWVHEGVGTVPIDDGSHAAFTADELKQHEPADKDAVAAFRQLRLEATTIAEAAATTATAAPSAPAPNKSAKAKAKAKGK